MPVPQTDISPHTSIRFCIKNQSTHTWFEYEFDLIRGRGFKDIRDKVNDKSNMFAFLAFKDLKKEAGIWLEKNSDNMHYTEVSGIYCKVCDVKNKIQQEHSLNDDKATEYRKQVPKVNVRAANGSFHVTSDGWLDEWIGMSYDDAIKGVERLHNKIMECFQVFLSMVCCQIEREIMNTLRTIEKAFFRDEHLITIKTVFDERETLPMLDIKKWIGHTSTKTNSDGTANPDYIPGMEDLRGRDLTMAGPRAQAFVTRVLCEGKKLKVLGVENQPHDPGVNPATKQRYDADICLEYDSKELFVQVGVREGELAKQVSDSILCVGEEIRPTPAISKYGGTDMDYGKKFDFAALCKKLAQIPPGGVVLWASSHALLPRSGPTPLKEWYGNILNKKCIILWMPDKSEATIHHNETGFDLACAKKLCEALGVAEHTVHTDSKYSLDRSFFDLGVW